MSEYIRKTWRDGETITDAALNNIETGIEEAKREAENSRVAAENAKGAAVAPNLLDNSDFTKPVAQAGVSASHGGAEIYAVDRWILTGTVSRTTAGLVLNGTMTQRLETVPAGRVSAFVGMASGTATITYADGEVTITSAGGTIAWAALYNGSYAADNMPVYLPKGYATELMECKRYFRHVRGGGIPGFMNASVGYFGLPVEIPMRVTPTVTVNAYGTIRGNGVSITPTGITASSNYPSVIGLTVTYANQSNANNHAGVLASGADFMLCADLARRG